MENYEARLNITFGGNNGDARDPIRFDATDADIKGWATEMIRTTGVPGIPADPNADFTDFVVDRFNATADVPMNRISLRPKATFGF